MRILISDYSGHPFQVQLSRELARRGHTVLHTYSASFQTPKANLVKSTNDPANFSIEAVGKSQQFAKNSFFKRRKQEIEIGKELAKLVGSFSPDIVISSNAPLDTQRLFQKAAQDNYAKFIFWLQDIYSEAISRVVPKRFPIFGSFVAALYRNLEFRMLRESDHVIAITCDFVPIIVRQGVNETAVSVIENWAPLDELPTLPRDNEWANSNMPGDLRIVYSGTLGYKHNPELMLNMAAEISGSHIHVFSEGLVADKLRNDAAKGGLKNFTVHPWVSFEDLPKMLSGADIFVAVIDREAGVYSVPSKVLTYLAIGRPILASVPPQNLAARLIVDNQAGFVCSPGNETSFLQRAREVAADSELRRQFGNNGRAYALRAFNLTDIGNHFESIFQKL